MTRILLDGRPCSSATGIGRYARTVIRAVPRFDEERAYSVLSWRREANRLRRLADSRCKIVAAFPGPIFAQLETHAVPIPQLHRWTVFHGTSYNVPRYAGTRTIGTFYDVAYLRVPDAYPAGVADGFDRCVRRALEYVDCIVTVSNHAKADLVAAYGFDEQRIKVIYPAAVIPRGHSGLDRPIFEGGNRQPFMLFVGEIGHRKNVVNLVRAFARVAGAIPHRLVLAGPDGPLDGYLEKVRSEIATLGLTDRVRLTGWLSDDELASLYRSADAVLLPSLYEGFGYPLVDAMAYGKPILTSNLSSMPEIAGDAALLVNPLDIGEIAEALMALAGDDRIRRSLAESGRRRAGLFTTEAMVDSLQCLYTALGATKN